MLLSHTLNVMLHMLKICDQFAVDFDIKFNSSQSVAMRIGRRFNDTCKPLQLAGGKFSLPMYLP